MKTDLRLLHGLTMTIDNIDPRGVALDGAVQGPRMGYAGDRWSFDHHGGCHRLITSATCEQVYRALVQGFDFTNRPVYVNDLDGDTLLSIWLIESADRVRWPQVRDLVRAVGAVDSHGPAGKLELSEAELRLANIFFSSRGVYSVIPRDAQKRFDEWSEIIAKGIKMIDALVEGYLDNVEPDAAPEYEELEAYKGLVMVKSAGFGAFEPLYRAGYTVVIVTDGEGTFTVGKRSDLVNYPLGPVAEKGTLLAQLAAFEPGWGGGSSIGGSPRPGGSKLDPDQVWEIAKALYRS